jgi:H+-transporting ATPase
VVVWSKFRISKDTSYNIEKQPSAHSLRRPTHHQSQSSSSPPAKMAAAAPNGNLDLENGSTKEEQRRVSYAPTVKDAGPAPQEEYAALGHYISNYRDTQQAESVHEEDKEKKKGFFSKKAKDSGGLGFETPAEWLTTPMDRGLASTEIEGRRKKAGWNELTTEKENLFIKFLMFFTGPILYVMEIAALLAAGLRDWVDLGVIIGILLLNAAVGWYQEKQAADVVASLKGDIALKALVVRDGSEQEIKARELVPGDIVSIPHLSFSILAQILQNSQFAQFALAHA